MASRQSDNKTTKQIRIDIGWHRILKIDAATSQKSIKEVLEGILTEHYPLEKINKMIK